MITEVPSFAKTDEEALIVLSHHLNSFLSALNFGGFHQAPFSKKDIAHIAVEKNQISQVSGGGDQYSETKLTRALHRYQPPLLMQSSLIDQTWIPKGIIAPSDLNKAYNQGNEILKNLNLATYESVISLEAYAYYTIHRWNSALLLGWSFTEILLDKIWDEKVVKLVASEEKGRRERLKDYRVYTAAVKIELLYSASVFDTSIYNALNSLRTKRNELIHESKPVFQKDAELIFSTIPGLIRIISEKEATFANPGWSRPGGWVS